MRLLLWLVTGGSYVSGLSRRTADGDRKTGSIPALPLVLVCARPVSGPRGVPNEGTLAKSSMRESSSNAVDEGSGGGARTLCVASIANPPLPRTNGNAARNAMRLASLCVCRKGERLAQRCPLRAAALPRAARPRTSRTAARLASLWRSQRRVGRFMNRPPSAPSAPCASRHHRWRRTGGVCPAAPRKWAPPRPASRRRAGTGAGRSGNTGSRARTPSNSAGPVRPQSTRARNFRSVAIRRPAPVCPPKLQRRRASSNREVSRSSVPAPPALLAHSQPTSLQPPTQNAVLPTTGRNRAGRSTCIRHAGGLDPCREASDTPTNQWCSFEPVL